MAEEKKKEGGGGKGDDVVRARELAELYKELQLLRLKYDQIIEICDKLSKPWPNRGSDGKLIKANDSSKPQSNSEKVQVDRPASTMPEKNFSPENCDSPELKLLDSILKKAQRIKIAEEEEPRKEMARRASSSDKPTKMVGKPRKTGAVVQAKATTEISQRDQKKTSSNKRLGQHKTSLRSSTKTANLHSKSTTTSDDSSIFSNSEATCPPVTIVKHTSGPADRRRGTRGKISVSRGSGAGSLPSRTQPSISSNSPSFREDYDGEDDKKTFNLSRDGTKLKMPSRYTALRTKLLDFHGRVISGHSTDSSVTATREHFVNRLLPPDGRGSSTRAIEFELARQEYQLLTKEAKSLLAGSGGGGRDGVVTAREKLEPIVSRASSVEERMAMRVSSEATSERLTEKDRGMPSQSAQNQTSKHSHTSASSKPISDTKYDHHPPSTISYYDGQEEPPPPLVENVGPLLYSSLSEILEMVDLENRLRMTRIQSQLLKFTTQTVLPKYQHLIKEDLSTTSIQILNQLAGKPKPIFIIND